MNLSDFRVSTIEMHLEIDFTFFADFFTRRQTMFEISDFVWHAINVRKHDSNVALHCVCARFYSCDI